VREIYDGYAAILELPGVVEGTQLQPIETATSVRVDGGKTILNDRPMVEGETALSGSFVFDGSDLDRAIAAAEQIQRPEWAAESRCVRSPSSRKEDEMKYALLIYGASEDRNGFSGEERQTVYREYFAVNDAPGISAGTELQPPTAAKTIRVEDGQMLVSDGPFIAAREHLGGFYLFEAESFDAAAAMATDPSRPYRRRDRGTAGGGALDGARRGLP
jgi:hypothetical protein